MEKRQRLFIYDRKEIVVLILLGALVAVFAFTLGIHLGKRVGPKSGGLPPSDTTPALTQQDADPSRQDISEHSKGTHEVADEAMNQALHEEVQRTGIQMQTPKAVDLPNEPKARNAGATTPVEAPTRERAQGHAQDHSGDHEATEPPSKSLPSETRAEARKGGKRAAEHAPEQATAERATPEHAKAPAHAAGGKFTIQVGSYQTLGEARTLRERLESFGLKPYVRTANLGSKGTWHRVFVGNYTSSEEAAQMGSRYQSRKIIDSFVVAKAAE